MALTDAELTYIEAVATLKMPSIDVYKLDESSEFRFELEAFIARRIAEGWEPHYYDGGVRLRLSPLNYWEEGKLRDYETHLNNGDIIRMNPDIFSNRMTEALIDLFEGYEALGKAEIERRDDGTWVIDGEGGVEYPGFE